MTNAFVTMFNHRSLKGISEIADLLTTEFQRAGFNTTLCRSLPAEVKDGDLLIVVDEFSEPLVVEYLRRFRSARPKVRLVCVLTEFFFKGGWISPPSMNRFKQPVASLLFDNFLYVFCFLTGRLDRFPGLQIKVPGVVHYLLGAFGFLFLGLWKVRNPSIPTRKWGPFHDRAYLWFRSVGLQSMSGMFDFYLTLHPTIATEELAAALGTDRQKIQTLLMPPPAIEKSRLIDSELDFGLDLSGTLNRYRIGAARRILRRIARFSPGGRFCRFSARGFDDAQEKLLLSFNPPQSRTWRYSSPMRIIGAIKRGQIPLVTRKFGDHPAEDLAVMFPNDGDEIWLMVSSLVFDRQTYIDSAWAKLENYRKIADENNQKILRQLQAHKTRR